MRHFLAEPGAHRRAVIREIGISSALVLDIECLVYREYGLAAERQNMKFAWTKLYFGVVSAFLIHGCGSGKNDAAPAIGGGGGASAHGGAVNAGGAPSETPEGGAAGDTAGSAGSNSSAEGGASGADGMGEGGNGAAAGLGGEGGQANERTAFSLFVAQTPPGNPAKSAWGGILQFTASGDGSPLVSVTGIDKALVADPDSVAFRKESSELFIGNRHGGTAVDGVPGSISRFVYDREHGTLTPNGTISGNSLNDVTQVTFHPQTGELFAPNYYVSGSGPAISRFTFDADGSAVPNGTLGTGTAHGTLISPDGKHSTRPRARTVSFVSTTCRAVRPCRT